MKIDETAFVRAFGARPRSGLDLEKWKKLRTTVAIYLAELPEPEPGCDRIAVVVDVRGRGMADIVGPPLPAVDEESWQALEHDARKSSGRSGPFARAIVRCDQGCGVCGGARSGVRT